MRIIISSPPKKAFTRADLCVVVATACFLTLLGGTALAKMQPFSHRAGCANNLKQLGVAIRSFANEHGNLAPWFTKPMDGGTAARPAGYQHFPILSNYVASPRVFSCPGNPTNTAAIDYSSNPGRGYFALNQKAVGYYIATHSTMDEPKSILLGDSMRIGGSSGSCVGMFNDYPPVPVQKYRVNGVWKENRWSETLHAQGIGNLVFADGMVRLVDDKGFFDATQNNPVNLSGTGCALMP